MRYNPPLRRWLLLVAILLTATLLTCCDPCTPADSGPFEGCCINMGTGDWCCQSDCGDWACW